MRLHKLRVLLDSLSEDSGLGALVDAEADNKTHDFSSSVELRGVVAVDADMAREIERSRVWITPGSVELISLKRRVTVPRWMVQRLFLLPRCALSMPRIVSTGEKRKKGIYSFSQVDRY